jgi:kynurenine formamidase
MGGSFGFISSSSIDYDDNSDKISFRVQQFSMHAAIGTHMDAPAHCFSNRETIDKIPLSNVFAPCAVIDVSFLAHENVRVKVEHLLAWEKNHGPIPGRVSLSSIPDGIVFLTTPIGTETI